MSGELGFALQIVGTVVGGVYGGPIGAYLGGLIGSVAGNALDPQTAQGPRLDDLRVRASTYGRPIPLVYGAENRIGGNVIWSGGLQEHEDTSGGGLFGGPEVTTFRYSASFAVAIGVGTMKNLDAIYANGKLLWTRQGAIDRIPSYQTRLALAQQGCIFHPIEQCAATNQNAAFYLSYDPAALMPDSTPWVLAPTVDAATSGGDGAAFGGRSATPWRYGEFDLLEWFPGTDDQPASAVIPAPTPAYRGTAYLVIRNLNLTRFGNTLPTIEVVVSGRPENTVAEILADFCDRAGASLDEVVPRGALSEFPVRGYAVASARSVMAAVQPMMQVYPFDACDHDGTLRFTPRRRSPVCTIDQSEMGARDPNDRRSAVFPVERIPDLEMPSECTVTYADPENGYQPGTQVAQRASGNAQTKLNQSLPFTMTADEARVVAERMLWEGWLSRENVKAVRLSRKYDLLQAGDTFAVPGPGGHTAFRILDIERGDNQIIELALAREDRLAYDGDLPGGAPFVFEQAAPYYDYTVPQFFNAPAITSGEDDTGFHVATDSPGTWISATIYRSTDGGTTFGAVGTRNRRDRIATVVGTLATGPADIWDRLNTLTIDLIQTAGAAPDTLTDEQVLAALTANLVWVGASDGSTGELLQFATATASATPGRYLLTGLLRGRRGTEYAIGAHGAGEVAVLLDAQSVGTLDFGQSDWNLSREYMAVSAREDVANEAMHYVFAGTGERLKPRAPVHGAGTRNGSNDLSITWVRRSRLFPPAMGYGATPLAEASERYELDVIVGGNAVRTISAVTPAASYSAAEQAADGITPGSPVTIKVYQISATFGRGHPGTFTI